MKSGMSINIIIFILIIGLTTSPIVYSIQINNIENKKETDRIDYNFDRFNIIVRENLQIYQDKGKQVIDITNANNENVATNILQYPIWNLPFISDISKEYMKTTLNIEFEEVHTRNIDFDIDSIVWEDKKFGLYARYDSHGNFVECCEIDEIEALYMYDNQKGWEALNPDAGGINRIENEYFGVDIDKVITVSEERQVNLFRYNFTRWDEEFSSTDYPILIVEWRSTENVGRLTIKTDRDEDYQVIFEPIEECGCIEMQGNVRKPYLNYYGGAYSENWEKTMYILPEDRIIKNIVMGIDTGNPKSHEIDLSPLGRDVYDMRYNSTALENEWNKQHFQIRSITFANGTMTIPEISVKLNNVTKINYPVNISLTPGLYTIPILSYKIPIEFNELRSNNILEIQTGEFTNILMSKADITLRFDLQEATDERSFIQNMQVPINILFLSLGIMIFSFVIIKLNRIKKEMMK